MNKQEKLDIVATLQDIQTEKGYNQKELASSIGIGHQTLNHMYKKGNDNWQQNIKGQLKNLVGSASWNKARAYIGVIRPRDWQFAITDNATEITGVCQRAKKFSEMLLVIGPTGSGKTSTFKKQERATVFLVECKKYKSSPHKFFKQLAKSMRMEAAGTTEQLIERIIERLTSIHRPLIILDEANKLQPGVFGYIHGIYNEIVGQVGIVLAGTMELKKNIDRWSINNRMGFEEFEGRITDTAIVDMPTIKDRIKVVQQQGITNMNICKYIAHNSMNFRKLKAHLQNIRFEASGRAITLDLVEEYFEES